MKSLKPHWQNIAIFFTCFVMGFLVVLQWRSFGRVRETYLRDKNANIFREIQLSKVITDQLEAEIENQQKQLGEISSQASSLLSLQNEMEKYQLLSGTVDIEGPGLRIQIPQITDTSWFVDLQNELSTAGAQAIAINGIRISTGAAGFRAIPPRTLLLGNRSLRPPFIIEVIGDSKLMANTILQPGGIIPRLQKTFGKKDITLAEVERLKILALAQ